MRRLLLMAALTVLAACGDQPAGTIDGTSKQAAEDSIKAIDAALAADKRAEFDAAIAMGWPLSQIAGKTAEDVIAMARAKAIAAMKDKTIPALQGKLAEAEKAAADAKEGGGASKRFLKAISLLKPDFTWRDTNGTPSPLFTFSMQNGSSEAIQTIVFNAKISAPGGGKPFIDQRFTFKFAEAVTTGESKFVFVTPDLTLPGNAGALQAKGVAKLDFDIDFVRVDDLNGRPIMDDEAGPKAEADLQAARDALALAEAKLKALEAGGSIVGA